MNLTRRPRRLRTTAAMRALTAETALRPEQLIQVFFVRDGISEPQPISSMPGQYQHTLESLIPAVRQAAEAGIKGIDLFGVPLDDDKDEVGSAAWDENGILNRAIAACRAEFGDEIVIMADTCLDEFTSHGHCGVLVDDGYGTMIVDNDATVELYCKMAVSRGTHGVPFRHDGRTDCRNARRAGRGRVPERLYHGVFGEVCLRVLWSVPRCGGV